MVLDEAEAILGILIRMQVRAKIRREAVNALTKDILGNAVRTVIEGLYEQ
jgi:hypothetical protein